MYDFVGPHRAVSTTEFIELALGTPVELWLGVEGESDEERAAREAAARDILADDPGMLDRVTTAVALRRSAGPCRSCSRRPALPHGHVVRRRAGRKGWRHDAPR